jgi:outer membrane receptor protein involved in Fe transport
VNIKSMRARLMASSMICGAAALAAGGQAFAQQAAGGPSEVKEIVVTGSRIPTPNLTSVSPITSVGSQQVQLQGVQNVEDLINNLPQAFGDFGNYESNGASGTATINLRGLGNTRTLVLINGQRMMPGDPITPAPDINMIPAALIDRVDVLTGGASATYGSDAMAGVVNFILKKNFQGLEIDSTSSVAQNGGGNAQTAHANANAVNSLGAPSITFPGAVWDGWKQTVTITGGANAPDDRGNVEFYLGYTYVEAVDEGQRDYTKCTLATNNTSTLFQYCGGSSTSTIGRLYPFGGPNQFSASGKQKSYGILGTPTAAGLLPSFNNGFLFNYAPYNYLQRPDQRYTAGEFSHYDVNSWLTLFSSFMFMDDHSAAAIAPSGSFAGDRTYTIHCDNPLLSAAQSNTICGPGPYAPTQTVPVWIGRRNVEGGPRISDLEHMDYQMTFGAKGNIGDGWNYDLTGVYGRAVLNETEQNYFLYDKLINALDVVPGPGGVPTCVSALPGGSDTACIPYNIWSPGGVNQAQINYLTGVAKSSGSVTQSGVVLNLTNADLSKYGLKLPWASKGVGVAVGAEYRYNSLETQYDSLFQSGALAGLGGSLKNTSGSQIAKEIYGELLVPIASDMAFFRDLSADLSARYSDYSHGGGNWTYKAGLQWAITPDVKLRGSIERAARAPNVDDLFVPATPGLFAGTDPCAGANPTLSAAQCYNTILHSAPGMSLATFTNTVYGSITQCISAQCGSFSGGNPNLVPEIGNTYSAGVQLTPSFLRGFSATVDYWSIKINKAIIPLPGQLLLTNCATLGAAFDCNNINRNTDPGGGFAVFGGNGKGFVDLQLVNASALKTSGIDVNVNYHTNFSDWHLGNWGGLNFNFMGTYVHELKTALPDGSSYDCSGLYGVTCGTPTPHWKHQFRVTWATPWKVDISGNWRYISSSNLDFNTDQPDLQNGFKDLLPTDAHIGSFSYFDLAVNWRVRDGLSARIGVNNIFDKTPPLLDANSFGISAPPFGNGNTYPEVYDPLGRVIFLGLTANF